MLATTQAVFAEDNFEKKAQVNNWNSIYKIIRMKCQTGHFCFLGVFLMLKFSVKINVPPGQNLARASGKHEIKNAQNMTTAFRKFQTWKSFYIGDEIFWDLTDCTSITVFNRDFSKKSNPKKAIKNEERCHE